MDFADRLRRLDNRILGVPKPVNSRLQPKLFAWALMLFISALVVPFATHRAQLIPPAAGFAGLAVGSGVRLHRGRMRLTGRHFAMPLCFLAGICVLAAVLLSASRPGDVSIADDCQRSSFSVYRDPLPEVRDGLSGLTVGKLCNDSAASRMHRAIGLGTVAVLSAATGLVLRRRATPDMPSGTPGA